MKNKITIVAIVLIIIGCANAIQSVTQYSPEVFADNATTVAVHDSFKDHFMIGTALSATQIVGSERFKLDLVKREFNAVTAENVMKWELIHPKPKEYDFTAADQLAKFAEKNDLFLLGHTLLWHNQTPKWVFENRDGSAVSREKLLERLQDHINTVAGRYQNDVDAWDVVNEALNEDGSLRESPWYTILGEDYIEQVFIMADTAAPNAKLYYNDYNLFKPEKREGAIRLVKKLQAKGIRIDGIGIQGHYGLDYPDLNELESSIKAFAELGIDIVISELDITVLPFPQEHEQGADITLNVVVGGRFNPYRKALPDDVQQQQAERYQAIFAILNRHKDNISRVSFWGVDDAASWRNDWPVKGRTDYPLLFDRELRKKAFVASLPTAE